MSHAATGERADRLSALDGLRGMAALGVAFHHTGPMFGRFLPMTCGWVFVDLFFLISGIVMMHVYESKIVAGRLSFSEFLAHRFARLWPLHAFMLLVTALVCLARLHFSGLSEAARSSGPAPLYTFFLNLSLLQCAGLSRNEFWNSWNGIAWSLTPELLLNGVWFYFVFKRRLSSVFLVASVAVSAFLFFNLPWKSPLVGWLQFITLPRCAVSFGLGCLLYRHLYRPGVPAAGTNRFPLSAGWAGGLAAALLVAIQLNEARWHSPIFADWPYLAIFFLFPLVVHGALRQGTVLNRLFSSRPLTFLGAISYSVYLCQLQLLFVVEETNRRLFHSALSPVQLGPIFLVLLLVTATVLYRFVEVPLRKKTRPVFEALFGGVFAGREPMA